MNKKANSRNGFIHLYNPKEEGIGSYDVHYINAYQREIDSKRKQNRKVEERYAA